MTNTETPPPVTPHTVTPDAVTDAVTAEVDELYRVGVNRAQAVDSLHSVANELIQPLITPGPAQRSALACADALRAAATRLADHDDDPRRWTPTELQYDHHATTDSAESPTTAAPTPTPPTGTPPPTDVPPPAPTDAPPPAPQYPPGLDVSKYVRAPLAPQHPGRT